MNNEYGKPFDKHCNKCGERLYNVNRSEDDSPEVYICPVCQHEALIKAKETLDTMKANYVFVPVEMQNMLEQSITKIKEVTV